MTPSPARACSRTRARGPARLALGLGAGAIAMLLAAPAAAVAPDGASDREPYAYPAPTEVPEAYPRGWVRVPAIAADLLLVRPLLAVGLVAGAGLFVASLPFTGPTLTADDAAHALFDQTLDAATRPLGEF